MVQHKGRFHGMLQNLNETFSHDEGYSSILSQIDSDHLDHYQQC